MVCDIIRNDTHLSNGFNAIGFSQGGQFLCVLKLSYIILLELQHLYKFKACGCTTLFRCKYKIIDFNRWPTSRSLW
jgi:hypothetical protein